jgi:alpha-D-xyloside xylohydrolase
MSSISKQITLVLVAQVMLFLCSKGQMTVSNTATGISLSSPVSKLTIDRAKWKLTLLDKQGIVLWREANPPAFYFANAWHKVIGIKNVKRREHDMVELDVEISGNKKASARISLVKDHSFRISIGVEGETPDSIRLESELGVKEEVYGFGEMWNGQVAQRGKKLDLWDKTGTPDECAYIPYYVTTRNYAFFLDYGGRVSADVAHSNKNKIVIQATSPAVEFLLTTGNSIAQTVKHYLQVTGMPAMPPRWSFKPWFWLMSDPDQPKGDISTLTAKGVISAAKRFKQLDIPVGVTWLEPPWQTQRNSFIPDTAFSANFRSFMDELHGMGLKVLAWTTPYTTQLSPNWKEAIANGYIVKKPDGEVPQPIISSSGEIAVGGYHYIDFSNPSAKKWWQQEIEKALDLGFDGFKLDDGQNLPEDAILYNNELGKHSHNSYATAYNKTFFEVLNKRYKGDFLTIPRAAWSGSNQYLGFKWPGDLQADLSQAGLPYSVYSSISLGFSGFPFLSTDIGGFEDIPGNETTWVRWAQFGALLPGMQTLNMPWWFSEEAAAHYRYLSWLHTDMLPFWMSLARDAVQNGTPLCKPLVWDFQGDEKTWNISDQFLIGGSLLAAPVITDKNSRRLYLPKANWYDFFTGEKHTGGREIEWKGGLYEFPLYVREGAIIPFEISNSVSGFGSASSVGYRTIAVWPSTSPASNSFLLHDEGAPVLIKTTTGKNKFQLNWTDQKNKYLFRIHWERQAAPAEIRYAGNTLLPAIRTRAAFDIAERGWFYDDQEKKLWIKTTESTLNTIEVRFSQHNAKATNY